MLNHAFPFFFTIIFNHCFLFLLTVKIYGHTCCISFGMKLRTNKIIIKANSHNSSFKVSYMRPLFFNCQYLYTQLVYAIVIWFYYLVIAAVNCIKRIFHTVKNMFNRAIICHVNRKCSKAG